jgi:hypothetical protein
MHYPTTHTHRKRKDGAAASSASPGILSPAPRQPDLAKAEKSGNFVVARTKSGRALDSSERGSRFVQNLVKPPARPNSLTHDLGNPAGHLPK